MSLKTIFKLGGGFFTPPVQYEDTGSHDWVSLEPVVKAIEEKHPYIGRRVRFTTVENNDCEGVLLAMNPRQGEHRWIIEMDDGRVVVATRIQFLDREGARDES